MDDVKNLSQAERSQSPNEESAIHSDVTKSLSATRDWGASFACSTGILEGNPKEIGRYRIIHRLGQGGFGWVYLGHDDELDRPVAIKVPNPERITHAEDVEAFLKEARILAQLDHPNIVPVHDIGRTEDGICFVVSKLVEGSDLAVRMKEARPSVHDSAHLVATIAEALHYAHTRGLVHRDIKPANILLDASGKPSLADFGLALRDEDFGKGTEGAGTPSYMSPEQARGEGHRVDGRSDIFSLGVVLYELLTGKKPFRGDSHLDVMEQVVNIEPRPPRQLDDTIPRELERICQKAMMKRVTERYTTAKDMAEDLRFFLHTIAGTGVPAAQAVPAAHAGSTLEEALLPSTSPRSDSPRRPIKIVPKGLRSFDQGDADFFLELLPGPRDRDGLPESIRFWKGKIEQIDPDLTFSVALIYGPSGCGKSSWVKAGLLPRLGKHVLPVYIEATAEATEIRLLRGIRKLCPELPKGLGLVDSLAQVRRGRVLPPLRKLLLILDQFEQWLHAKRGKQNTELVAALRNCDGEHAQSVVLVRDDFWLAASRFMRDLEIRLVEGENSALVDLFDARHARAVLAAFGIAYGSLPERTSDISRDQHSFLEQAVTDLAQDGKVISVRLALFAEMVKGKPWTPASLRAVGGTEGVGITFLEETFCATTAPPEHHLQQKAAQAVLKALLPDTGTDIKGQMRSEGELQKAAAYADRPRDFAGLIHILDNELRLITPTEPAGVSEGQPSASPGGRYFQLTHDFLVPSLRDWLTHKQKETWRGRAELRLEDRSALWNAKPENRRLPSLVEWANIRSLTRKRNWTEPQKRMMKQAGWVHGSRVVVTLALVGLLTWGGVEGYGNLRGSWLVEELATADTADVPAIIKQLSGYRRWVNLRLRNLFQNAGETSREKLHASLALLPVDPSQLPFVEKHLLDATPTELRVIRGAMEPYRAVLVAKLWTNLQSAQLSDVSLLPTASALAKYDASSQRWESSADKVAQAVIRVDRAFLSSWLEALRPVRGKLNAPLAAIFRDKLRPSSERALAANILADYASDNPNLVADLLMDADAKVYGALFRIVESRSEEALPLVEKEIHKTEIQAATELQSEQLRDQLAERQARAAVALVRMGKAKEVLPLLQHSPDPRLRSYIVNWLSALGADPMVILAQLDHIPSTTRLTPTSGQQFMDAVLFHPETSIRRALILAIGTYASEKVSPRERKSLVGKLVDLYRNDPDAGIHGAATWTLRQWRQEETLKRLDAELMTQNNRAERRWFVNSQAQTFAVIEGPVEFRMGSPRTDTERIAEREILRRMTIPRRFAIATQEVSVEQYQRFVQQSASYGLGASKYGPDQKGPVVGPTWYHAAAYCNWLSRQEGLAECYEPNSDHRYGEGMKIRPDALRLGGYRLPTEAEWEYACRAGALTSRFYGASLDLLGRYAWHYSTSQDHAWPCGRLLPNELGLFDMLGNVWEWCQDFLVVKQATTIDESIQMTNAVVPTSHVLRGGSFSTRPTDVRSAGRAGDIPAVRNPYYGFRLARTCSRVGRPDQVQEGHARNEGRNSRLVCAN